MYLKKTSKPKGKFSMIWLLLPLFSLPFSIYVSAQAYETKSPPSILESTDIARILKPPRLLFVINQLLEKGDLNEARQYYKYFDCQLVDEKIIAHSNRVIGKMKESGISIVATTDPSRNPEKNELVIVYGNYHHAHNNLPYTDKIWRHPIYFKDITHSRCEFHPAWESIGVIYIINLKERTDRYQEVLAELCRMHAPLDRIHHFIAHKETPTEDKDLDPHISRLKSHRDATDHFLKSSHQHCAIFEDDVTFTADIDGNLERLKQFFAKNYDYEVCLMNASKYDEIKEHDDLLLKSYQEDTTCSAYLLSKKGAERASFYLRDGYEKLIDTRDTKYAHGCYWSEMQKDNKFFLFKTKFGYQRPGYSEITGETACYFD
jgi:GR25 family glycosyltransferase involved in LPS biosynthesis